MTRLHSWFFLPLLLLSGGCSAFGPQEIPAQWVEHVVVDGPPTRDILHACNLALVRAQMPPGELDQVGGRVVSGWDVNLSPYSKRGTREQAIIEVKDLGNREYEVRMRVRVERNMEKHKPLVASKAKWEEFQENPRRAKLILEHLLSQVSPRRGR
ncbi:MAG: hypothetical protein MK213_07555 [Planctomycetes bacterium]|nr:hypothetical protein [Planctomycetota bacterium]